MKLFKELFKQFCELVGLDNMHAGAHASRLRTKVGFVDANPDFNTPLEVVIRLGGVDEGLYISDTNNVAVSQKDGRICFVRKTDEPCSVHLNIVGPLKEVSADGTIVVKVYSTSPDVQPGITLLTTLEAEVHVYSSHQQLQSSSKDNSFVRYYPVSEAFPAKSFF